jgi:hypothetical protein
MKCPSCHFETPEGINFCGQCSEKLNASIEATKPRPSAEGDRKRAAALFSDIDG